MMSAVETNALAEDASVARDESRLSMLAYWLERYRDADFASADDIEAKYQQLISNLETPAARAVAEAWFANRPVPEDNRLGPVANRIQRWASTISGSRRD